MANQIPEMLINFRVYNDAENMLGVADVTLPTIAAITQTVSGAGIAGEVDQPVMGHYGSMTTSINFRTVTRSIIELSATTTHNIEVRGSIQVEDAGGGGIKSVPLRVAMTVVPKSTDLGSVAMGSTMDASGEYEVRRIKVWYDGTAVREIDKFNYIDKTGDTDILDSVREHLGFN
jgi:hypothetical protein